MSNDKEKMTSAHRAPEKVEICHTVKREMCHVIENDPPCKLLGCDEEHVSMPLLHQETHPLTAGENVVSQEAQSQSILPINIAKCKFPVVPQYNGFPSRLPQNSQPAIPQYNGLPSRLPQNSQPAIPQYNSLPARLPQNSQPAILQYNGLPESLPQNSQPANMPQQTISVANDSTLSAHTNATINLVKRIEGDNARYGCNVMINSEVVYKEIPVKHFTAGKWLNGLIGFAVFQGSKSWRFLEGYLNNLVASFAGPSILEIEIGGWYNHRGTMIYVTPDGAIGVPYPVFSRKGQRYKSRMMEGISGSLIEYLSMGALTPTKPVADIILLYNVLGFLYSVFKDAGCPIKFLIFLTGRRGSFKTTLALALTQIENRKSPEFIMKSTSAGLEAGFSTYRDAVMLIDDLAPTIDSNEQRAMQNNLELMVRCFGDGTGKKRNMDFLSPDVKVNQYVAAGGAIITGEYVTGVESSLARCLILSITEGDVDTKLLKKLQDDETWLSRFLSGFLCYVSSKYSYIVEKIRQTTETVRTEAPRIYSNPRYSEYSAQLFAVVEILIDYGLSTRQIDLQQSQNIRSHLISSIEYVVAENDRNLVDESPAAYLCRAILEALDGGNYKILPINALECSNSCIFYDDVFFYIAQPMLKKIKGEYDRENGISYANPLTAVKNLTKILADAHIIAVHQEGSETRYAKKIAGGGNRRYICVFKDRLKQYDRS